MISQNVQLRYKRSNISKNRSSGSHTVPFRSGAAGPASVPAAAYPADGPHLPVVQELPAPHGLHPPRLRQPAGVSAAARNLHLHLRGAGNAGNAQVTNLEPRHCILWILFVKNYSFRWWYGRVCLLLLGASQPTFPPKFPPLFIPIC